MAEYTPTTEQVREGFAEDPVAEYHDPITNHAAHGRRAFDRWLAAHDREVAERAFDEGVHAPHSSMNPYRVDGQETGQ